jgi:hypothetical protein
MFSFIIENMPENQDFPFNRPQPDQLPEKTPAEPENSALLDRPAAKIDPVTALAQLAVGGTLEGSQLFMQILNDWVQQNPPDPNVLDAQPNETDADRNRYALLGALLDLTQAAGSGTTRLGNLFRGMSNLGMAPLKSIGNSLPMRPMRTGFDKLVARGERRMDRWVEKGRAADLRSRRMTREVATGSIGNVVEYFSANEEIQVLIQGQVELMVGNLPHTPELDQLVQGLAGNYLAYIDQHPEALAGLIEGQADQYLDHLEKHPEKVQEILQGQSLSLLGAIQIELRQRATMVDTILEKVARGILRKTPRSQLPPPPADVMARAETGRRPGEFRRLAKMQEDSHE